MLCGGFSNVRDAEDDDQEVLNHVKEEIKQQVGGEGKNIRALKVATQVVAGINYLMKVKYDDKYVHVKIAKPLPHTGQNPFILAIADQASEDSPLVAFE